jgi:HAMP domain-containing protein
MLAIATLAIWFSPLDLPASESLDAGTKRAFLTFASARGLNAAISFLQGTEITAGAGVTATISVGQVLDPVNDLVEQFAEMMLIATVSFGVQEILLTMGRDEAVKITLTVIFVGCILWLAAGRSLPRWTKGLLILGLMFRFAIPMATVGTEFVFRHFLEQEYQASESAIADTTSSMKDLAADRDAAPPGEDEQTWWQRRLSEMKDLAQNVNVGGRIDELQESVSGVAENVVRLIVVFLLQTLVIPIAILWTLYAAVRYVFSAADR